MSTIRLLAFTPKTAPVGADELYGADSANGFSEIRTTIAQIIANNAIPTISGTPSASNLQVWASPTTSADSGITVDHSQNLTNVGNINGISITGLLVKANNLSDIASASAARTNLGLGTAAIKTATGSGSNVASVTGSFTVGHVAVFADTAGTIEDGGSASGFLLSANNLSDVASKLTAFNTISPLTTKGDVISFDGTNNIRVPVGANGLVITADSTQTAGWKWDTVTTDLPLTAVGDLLTFANGALARLPVGTDGDVLLADSAQTDGIKWGPSPGVTGFQDDATFVSGDGIIISTTLSSVPIDTILASNPGSAWATNGDGFGMKCGTQGTYLFMGLTPIQHIGQSAGYVYFAFYKNGLKVSPNIPFFLTGVAAVIPQFFFAPITCAVDDVISVQTFSGNTTPANTYSVCPASTTGADYATAVTIMRLI